MAALTPEGAKRVAPSTGAKHVVPSTGAKHVVPLAGAKRVVIKIGSALLVDRASGELRVDWLTGLAADVATLKAAGTDVILVSSGAIALGRGALSLGADALSLEEAQAAAAVGQIRLARAYEEALAPHGLISAQILLTLDDSADRRRYLNTRATFAALLARGAVPIVNENDTIATDEIRYGDNDRLAANVAVMAGADICVLLSDIDGLYTAPPDTPGARHLPQVDEITPEIEAMVRPLEGRDEDQDHGRAHGHGGGLCDGDHARRGRPAVAGADGWRHGHVVHGDADPATGAQGLDRGDEAQGRSASRCGGGGRDGTGQVVVACGRDGG